MSKMKNTILVIISLGFFIYTINYSNKIKYLDDRNCRPASGFGEWLSSIIFAITLATIVHTYFIQPFIIPTGSLEKTLLVGDFLFVSKYHYGARVPKTVVAFPMVHDTIVGTGLRSYLNKPQLPYLRLPKLQSVRRNEIVTFNWPADTVRQFFVKEKGVIKIKWINIFKKRKRVILGYKKNQIKIKKVEFHKNTQTLKKLI